MGGTNEDEGGQAGIQPLKPVKQERRRGSAGVVARRAAVTRAIGRLRLEEFQNTLAGLAVAVFGQQATVVAHLRASAGREWLTFVVDAADPVSIVQYEDFLPRERAFWTAYAQIVKPAGVKYMVAVRPARGWCRVEALAPLFSMLQPAQITT
jgi:hypothetical protein